MDLGHRLAVDSECSFTLDSEHRPSVDSEHRTTVDLKHRPIMGSEYRLTCIQSGPILYSEYILVWILTYYGHSQV